MFSKFLSSSSSVLCSDNREKDQKQLNQKKEWKWSKHTNHFNPKSKKRKNVFNNTSHEHFIDDFNKFDQIHDETNVYIGSEKGIRKE